MVAIKGTTIGCYETIIEQITNDVGITCTINRLVSSLR